LIFDSIRVSFGQKPPGEILGAHRLLRNYHSRMHIPAVAYSSCFQLFVYPILELQPVRAIAWIAGREYDLASWQAHAQL
jgi:hypothetical protein